jgi:ParB family chromosome partitioning protein
MGLDRSTISNLIRLLELPEPVQEAVRHGRISNGHAKALLAFADPGQQIAVCNQIVALGLSVRAVEAMTQGPSATPTRSPRSTSPSKTRHVQAIEEELRQALATKVDIRLRDKSRGQIVIDFESNDDFERIVERLGGVPSVSR